MITQLVVDLRALLQSANDALLSLVGQRLFAVLASKNIALMRELLFVAGAPDFLAVVDLVRGLPLAGWA